MTAPQFRVAVVVPSRGRPANALRLIREAANPGDCRLRWFVVVDSDDHRLSTYREVLRPYAQASKASVLDAGPRGGMYSSFRRNVNHGFEFVFGPWRADAAIMLGDDTMPRTAHWATQLGMYAWSADGTSGRSGIGMSYPNDGHQGEAKPTAICFSRPMYQALGFALPDAMEHLFTDDYWLRLGQLTHRLEYCERVLIDHLHPHAGRAPMDQGYSDVYAKRQWERDGERWKAYRATAMIADVNRVKTAIERAR